MRLIIALLFCVSASGQTFYVSASASGGGVGTEGDPFTLAEAFANADAGDTYWIKAGNYGALQLTIFANGTDINPIRFYGYNTTIGDLDLSGTEYCNLNPSNTLPNTATTPVIMGTQTSGTPNQDQGLRFTGNYFEVRNLAFAYYNRPFEVQGNNNEARNIYIFQPGNHNVAQMAANLFSSSFPSGGYTGYGPRVQGDNMYLEGIDVVNAGAEGFRITNAASPVGNYLRVICTIGTGTYNNHSTADGNITDYHFLVGSNTSNGVFTNIIVDNPTNAIYPGHGIVVKPNYLNPATGHVFRNFRVDNSFIETQFPEANNIVFQDGEINSEDTGFRREVHGARIANASENVTIQRVVFNGARAMSWGWNEAIYPDIPGYNQGAVDLNLVDCLFNNTNGTPYSALAVSVNTPGGSNNYSTDGWVIDHVTVYDYFYLWEISKPNSGIAMTNMVVDDVTQEVVNRGGYSGSFSGTYSRSNFSNGFSAPSGTNITTLAPNFANVGTGDFSLGNASLQGISDATSFFAGGLDIGYLDQAGGGGGDVTAPIASNITNSNITASSWRVDWTLNEPGTRYISYGPTTSYGTDTPESVGLYTSHFWEVTGYSPEGGLVNYVVRGQDAAGNTYQSANQTVQLSGTPPSPPSSQAWQLGLKSKRLKFRKF